MDANNEPWVWVMGDHPDDVSIETILEREAEARAAKLAQEEAEALRCVFIVQDYESIYKYSYPSNVIALSHIGLGISSDRLFVPRWQHFHSVINKVAHPIAIYIDLMKTYLIMQI